MSDDWFYIKDDCLKAAVELDEAIDAYEQAEQYVKEAETLLRTRRKELKYEREKAEAARLRYRDAMKKRGAAV